MHKILNPTWHGALDYGLVLAFLWAPGVLGFTHFPATLSQIIGVAYLAVTALTRYPLGLVKLIPFPLHGLVETLMASAWVAAPWIFEFAHDPRARNFFVAAGLGLLAVVALTDYRAMRWGGVHPGTERRRRLLDRRLRAMPVVHEHRTASRDRRHFGAA